MRKLFGFIFAAALLALISSTASAQTSLILTPSTDTQAPKTDYVEGDALINPRPDPTGWQFGLVRDIYGVTGNTEVGANVMFSRGGGYVNPVELQLDGKWRWYDKKESNGDHLAIASGIQAYIPIWNQNSPYSNTFAMAYTTASYRFGSDSGPRITGGAWGLINRQGDTGSKYGAMGGFELPFAALSKSKTAGKFTWVSDWMTGTQIHGGFSSLSTGLATNLTANDVLVTGYTWANSSNFVPGLVGANNGFFVFYGHTFSKWPWSHKSN